MSQYYGTRVLKPGDVGEDVRSLQIKIVIFGSEGKPVPCDGVFDSNTKSAVERFRKYFGLPESDLADGKLFTTIDEWADEMKPRMETILSAFKCKCSGKKKSDPNTYKRMIEVWDGSVRNKLSLVSGSKAGAPTCNGFGNELHQVALTKKQSWTYRASKSVTENAGMDLILFWAILGLHKIYETEKDGKKLLPTIDVHNGYRCNLDYFRICANAKYGASMGNHVGNAVDFHIELPNEGALRSYTKKTLGSYAANRKGHCSQINDDLLKFGVKETLNTSKTANTLRVEP